MTEGLPRTLLASLSNALAAQMGIHFPPNRTPDLERGIRAAAREFGFNNPGHCIEWLLSSSLTKPQIEILANQLTVGETYFFREKNAFRALEEAVLPELIRSHAVDRRLRIWSAACATGEEPYSLAILLKRMIPNQADWNISILATDINPRFLEKAAAGTYTTWSFRDCPKDISEKYFTKIDNGRLEIRPEIKKMVSFSYLNLMEDQYPSLRNATNAMNLIFCRNVLMYFAPEQAEGVIKKLHGCLLDGSWLVVSATEASHQLFYQFSTVSFPGSTLYRKDRQAVAPFSSFETIDEPTRLQELLASIDADSDPRDRDRPVFPEAALEETATNAGEPPSLPHPDPYGDYEKGRYSEAAEAAAAVLSANPEDVKAAALMARIQANQGHLEEALACCDRAIAVDRTDPALHYLRATILEEQGEALEAMNSLRRALFLDHRRVLAHFGLGNLSRSLGRPQAAERHFQNALSLLEEYQEEEIVGDSEGITAGRLRNIINANSCLEPRRRD